VLFRGVYIPVYNAIEGTFKAILGHFIINYGIVEGYKEERLKGHIIRDIYTHVLRMGQPYPQLLIYREYYFKRSVYGLGYGVGVTLYHAKPLI
jgi:hypothetical protein